MPEEGNFKVQTFSFRYRVFPSYEALPDEDRELLLSARRASKSAYAPYSGFLVGAALRLKSGKVFTGNNQENASYPAGICAERTALFYASSQNPEAVITTLALTARRVSGDTFCGASPCGVCRQAINEYEHKQSSPIRIIFEKSGGEVLLLPSASHLLPMAFSDDSL